MGTNAKHGSGRSGRGIRAGTIRAPKASGRQGTGFSGKRLRKGTIRSQNRYS